MCHYTVGFSRAAHDTGPPNLLINVFILVCLFMLLLFTQLAGFIKRLNYPRKHPTVTSTIVYNHNATFNMQRWSLIL